MVAGLTGNRLAGDLLAVDGFFDFVGRGGSFFFVPSFFVPFLMGSGFRGVGFFTASLALSATGVFLVTGGFVSAEPTLTGAGEGGGGLFGGFTAGTASAFAWGDAVSGLSLSALIGGFGPVPLATTRADVSLVTGDFVGVVALADGNGLGGGGGAFGLLVIPMSLKTAMTFGFLWLCACSTAN